MHPREFGAVARTLGAMTQRTGESVPIAELERLHAAARRRLVLSLLAFVSGVVLVFVGRALVNDVLASERAAGRDVRPWDVLDKSWPGMILLGIAILLAFGGTLSACLNALYARHVSNGIANLRGGTR